MFDRHMELERFVEELAIRLGNAEERIAKLEGEVSKLWTQQPGQGGGSAGIWFIEPVVIDPDDFITGASVYKLSGGSPVLVDSDATVRNVMAVATSDGTGQRIIVAKNDDGSYLAVSQSCPPEA